MSDAKPLRPLAPAGDASAALTALNRLFAQALLRIGKYGDADDRDAACRLAAQGWSMLRHDWPRDAERLNGVMHSLTGPRHTMRPQKAAKTPESETSIATRTCN